MGVRRDVARVCVCVCLEREALLRCGGKRSCVCVEQVTKRRADRRAGGGRCLPTPVETTRAFRPSPAAPNPTAASL